MGWLSLPSVFVSPYVLCCLVLSCVVLSCVVLSCVVVSCVVLSCLVLSCLFLSCLVLSCLVLSLSLSFLYVCFSLCVAVVIACLPLFPCCFSHSSSSSSSSTLLQGAYQSPTERATSAAICRNECVWGLAALPGVRVWGLPWLRRLGRRQSCADGDSRLPG
jgi:hypothetical protein